MSTTISFWDEYAIRVDGAAAERLERVYRAFVADRGADPTVELETAASIPTPEEALGIRTEYFGRNGETFVWRRGGDALAIDADWTRFVADPECSVGRLTLLVEWGLRRTLAEREYAMIHAAAVDDDGETIVFPAWRHTGKTNTLLTFLERGGDYLADDRLFVGTDGTARGFPTPVNLLPYNAQSFPSLAHRIPNERLFYLGKTMDAFAAGGSTAFHTAVSMLNNKFVKNRYWDVWARPDDLFEDTDPVAEASVDKVVLLRTNNERSTPSIAEIDGDRMAATLDAINAYEWNAELDELARGHDALFPARESKRARHRRLTRRERAILEECCESIPTYLLEVPSEEHWGEKLKEAIFREVASV